MPTERNNLTEVPNVDVQSCSCCDRYIVEDEDAGSLGVNTCGPDSEENFCNVCLRHSEFPRVQVVEFDGYEHDDRTVVVLFGRLLVEVYACTVEHDGQLFVDIDRECNPLDNCYLFPGVRPSGSWGTAQLPPRLLGDRTRALIEAAVRVHALNALRMRAAS